MVKIIRDHARRPFDGWRQNTARNIFISSGLTGLPFATLRSQWSKTATPARLAVIQTTQPNSAHAATKLIAALCGEASPHRRNTASKASNISERDNFFIEKLLSDNKHAHARGDFPALY